MSFTALYDACVLYPATVRDILMEVACTGLFKARWSRRIQNEWIDALLRDRSDLTRERLTRTAENMNQAVLDCLVEGFEAIEATLVLPDPNDCHVLAAAIHSGAEVIVTLNLKDFPDDVLRKYNIEAKTPDDFLLDTLDLNPRKVLNATKRILARLANPPFTWEEYLASISENGLTATAAALEEQAKQTKDATGSPSPLSSAR